MQREEYETRPAEYRRQLELLQPVQRYSSLATRRGPPSGDMPSAAQSIGGVPCYSLSPSGLFRCPQLEYRPEYYAQPNPFSLCESEWGSLYADRESGMTLDALTKKWGVCLTTVQRTLKRHEISVLGQGENRSAVAVL
jgi:hypothetical protein